MPAATIERGRYREAARLVAARPSALIARRRAYRTALLWSAAGFLAGAAFWHAIGFWRFISDVVFDAPPRPATMAAVAPPSQVSLPTIYLVDPNTCTALMLDRKTNSTATQRCPDSGLALRLEPNSARESLAVVSEPAMGPGLYPSN